MTSIFFVRHAQPDGSWKDDRTRPLTPLGTEDVKTVTKVLEGKKIHVFLSSPYRRSFDTVAGCAERYGMKIRVDERFRERRQGRDSGKYLEQRWTNFSFCEEGGESLGSVQKRNMEAFLEVLAAHEGKNIALGTHGTALSTMLNYYDPSFGCEDFRRIRPLMPYIIRLDFDGGRLAGTEELLKLDRGY